MSGYNGYSMSNNAVLAYHSGQRPKSKWTKSDILAQLTSLGYDTTNAKKLTVAEMKSLFLSWASWHHTSSMYNCTDFYKVSVNGVTDEHIAAVIVSRTTADKPKPEAVKALVRYGEWEGTRRHPRLVEKEAYAIIIGNWAYLCGQKKRTDGKHFRIVQTFTKAPKGTADIFKKIANDCGKMSK